MGRANNRSGIPGVYFDTKGQNWCVDCRVNNIRTVWYRTDDFFEACCRRKAWENLPREEKLRQIPRPAPRAEPRLTIMNFRWPPAKEHHP